MRMRTKLWVGLAAAGAGVWAWMRFGSGGRAAVTASRIVPPGYSSATNIFDSKRRPGVFYVYPIGMILGGFVQKTSRTLFIPNDTTQPGVWGEAA